MCVVSYTPPCKSTPATHSEVSGYAFLHGLNALFCCQIGQRSSRNPLCLANAQTDASHAKSAYVGMKLAYLQALRAVMESGTITEAAARLGRTQPQISRLIAELEQDLS